LITGAFLKSSGNVAFISFIVGIIAIVLAAIFSSPFFITPKFKSSARVYPSNISAISEESETEQMLEIMNSADIKLKMMKAFNLDEVYKIDKEFPQYLTAMLGDIQRTCCCQEN
jgi:hypothetical protein